MSSTTPAPGDQAASSAVDAAASAPSTVDAAAAPAPHDKEGKAQPESPAATATRLAELFPALFKGQPKPLKLRIQVDIQERAPGVFSKQALSAFFRRYTGATSYLIAVSKAAQRFDLDGQPAGELTDEHRKVAADELARRRANANAKREQEHQERRNRASLLRDFETTKLTTANFCALKGVAAEALDGLLAQARAEALEDAEQAKQRRPEHGRGGPHQRPGQGRREGTRDGEGAPRREGAAPGKGPGAGPRREGGGRPPRRP